MKDVMQQNDATVVGTPTLVGGALLRDTDQALTLNGSTSYVTVPDSASDSLAVVVGGAALEIWVRVSALPASTSLLAGKVGSYELSLRADGKLEWKLTNGASSVTVVSATALTLNVWHHLVGVYDGDYTGVTQFGYNTVGGSQFALPGDESMGSFTGQNNLWVYKATLLEKGQVTALTADFQRVHDATLSMWIVPVIYADLAGAPDALIVKGDPILYDPTLYVTRQWASLPLNAVLYPGDYWLGLMGGQNGGQMMIGGETSGGSRKQRNQVISSATVFTSDGSAPDPFGTAAVSDSDRLSLYAAYNALARTGDEGHALIYIDGLQDASAAYTAGIADTAAAFTYGNAVAGDYDEPAIYAKKLTKVQVARHYAAR